MMIAPPVMNGNDEQEDEPTNEDGIVDISQVWNPNEGNPNIRMQLWGMELEIPFRSSERCSG